MRSNIHPKWHPEAKVRCACGNEFTVGSTLPEIHIEICSACHPFFTGEAKYVDAAGRVEKFMERQKVTRGAYLSKKERRDIKRKERLEKELEAPTSLEEARKKTRS